jgi:hypothetical protein
MTDLLVIAKAIHKDRNPTRNWDFEPPTMKDFYKSCAAAAIAAERDEFVAKLAEAEWRVIQMRAEVNLADESMDMSAARIGELEAELAASLADTQRASFVRGELGNIEADRAMTSLTKPKPVDPLNRDEAYSDKLADNFRGWP